MLPSSFSSNPYRVCEWKKRRILEVEWWTCGEEKNYSSNFIRIPAPRKNELATQEHRIPREESEMCLNGYDFRVHKAGLLHHHHHHREKRGRSTKPRD